MNEKKLGIFIPIELINNLELYWINKVLLSEIISLTNVVSSLQQEMFSILPMKQPVLLHVI